MEFSIANWEAWAAGLESTSDWQQWANGVLPLANDLSLPKLPQVPAMQRRRLSPFAKLTLHCALEAAGDACSEVPAVFASRHGDLNRTSQLIKAVAQDDILSPTQFGLSVHNSVAGLFSIHAKNKMAISAIAAGRDSFIAGLIDAVAKLHARNLSQILYVYSDMQVPEVYQQFVEPMETSIAVGLLLEPVNAGDDHALSLTVDSSTSKDETYAPLSFMQFLNRPTQGDALFDCGNQSWRITRYVG